MRVKVKATGEIIDVAPVIRFIDGDAEWYAKKELVLLDGKEEIELAIALVEKLQKKEKTMKAKVIETGEIVEVREIYTSTIQTFGMEEVESYDIESVEIVTDPDYWTRLEHQYAGMAMQGILSNPESELDYIGDKTLPQALAGCAAKVAHALVQKLKEKEE